MRLTDSRRDVKSCAMSRWDQRGGAQSGGRAPRGAAAALSPRVAAAKTVCVDTGALRRTGCRSGVPEVTEGPEIEDRQCAERRSLRLSINTDILARRPGLYL
jgi:hypothetical protein